MIESSLLLPPRQVPLFWGRWLPHISVFQHGVDSLIAGIWGDINYSCESELSVRNGTCVFSGISFDCDVAFSSATGVCTVSGLEVVHKFKGIDPDKTDSLVYLLLIAVVCRMLIYILYLYPVRTVLLAVKRRWTSAGSRSMLGMALEQTRLRRMVDALQQEMAVLTMFQADDTSRAESPRERWMAHHSESLFAKNNSKTPSREGRDLLFRNVSVHLNKSKTKKTILHDVSGQAKAGRVCALMGECRLMASRLFSARAALCLLLAQPFRGLTFAVAH